MFVDIRGAEERARAEGKKGQEPQSPGAEVSKPLPVGQTQSTAGFSKQSFDGAWPRPLIYISSAAASRLAQLRTCQETEGPQSRNCSHSGPSERKCAGPCPQSLEAWLFSEEHEKPFRGLGTEE